MSDVLSGWTRRKAMGIGGVALVIIAATVATALAANLPNYASARGYGRLKDQLERAWKQVRAGVDDASKDAATIEALWSLQDAVAEANRMAMPGRRRGPAAEQQKVEAEYHRTYIELEILALTVEKALLAGDRELAVGTVGRMDELRKAAHEKYRH